MSTINGPSGILYRVEPMYETCDNMELPKCMYKVENIYGTVCQSTIVTHSTEEKNKLAELETYQQNILKKLKNMKSEVLAMKKELKIEELIEKPAKYQDIIISASPEYPPLSIWIIHQLVAKRLAVRLVTYIHSSLITVPETVEQLKGIASQKANDVSLTVIWKDVGKDALMMVDPIQQGAIEGEVNIARYIARLLKLEYENDFVAATQMDDWLELGHASIAHGNNKERQSALKNMNLYLGKNSFLVGSALSIADIVMWSLIVQAQLQQRLPVNVSKWWNDLSSMDIFRLPSQLIS